MTKKSPTENTPPTTSTGKKPETTPKVPAETERQRKKSSACNSFRDWIIRWKETAPWLILIITAVYSFISFLQWDSLKTQMELVKISTIPYIGTKNIEINKLEIGERISVNIFWENGGQTPAYNISVQSHIASLPGPITKDYIAKNINLSQKTCGFLPAGAIHHQTVFSPVVMVDEWLTRLNSKDLNLYVYGTAKYYDPFDRKNAHHLNFCAKYDPSRKKFLFCGIHNESN